MRGARILGIVLAISLLAAAGASASTAHRWSRAADDPVCGQATLFSRTFDVRTSGKPVPCGQALRIIDGRCKVHLHQKWSCFSFQVDAPFIVWFPTREMFERRWTRVVYYDRYPCSEAFISPELFAREAHGFPNIQQLLADDLIRCDMLAGQTYAQVRHLLGRPSEGKPGRYLSYELGLERDSFFQIDSEFLYVGFRNGVVGGLDIYQG
jgi:hypothetical protein